MSIEILATLGPSSLYEDTVVKMAENGVGLFRINLSHTALADVESVIGEIQSWTSVPVCLEPGKQLYLLM
jgi:pyruvate kinase